MSFPDALNTFNASTPRIRGSFSGGMYDSMNRMLSDTGSMLTAFSNSCAGVMRAAAACDAAVKKIFPRGGVEIDEEMRNLEREIGWDKRTGTFVDALSFPSVAHASTSSSSGRGLFAKTPSHPSVTGAAHRTLSSMRTSSPHAAAAPSRVPVVSVSRPTPVSPPARPVASSAPVTTRTSAASHAMNIPLATPSHASGLGASLMARNYREAFETFKTKLFPALRSCGMFLIKGKEASDSLDVAWRKVAELNALVGRKFDVTGFNRQASEVQRLISEHRACCSAAERRIDLQKNFLSNLDHNIRRNIVTVRSRLNDDESRLGRRFGWMKRCLVLLSDVERRYQGVVNQVEDGVSRNQANVTRLNAIAAELSSKTASLGKAKDGEDLRRASIQSCTNEVTVALRKSQTAHMAIVPKSKLSFTLRTSGSRYVLSPSKSDALNEGQKTLNACLGLLEASAAKMMALQKPTERLSPADINSTDVFPAFIVADSCVFAHGGRTCCVPIPTTFPLSKPRRFSDASEIAPFLLRMLCALPAGSVQITILDHASGGANGSVFNGLRSGAGTFRLVSRIDELHSVLKEHSDYIADLTSSGKFGATDRTWSEYNAHHPKNPLPCKMLVVYSFRGWDWQDVDEFSNLIANGAPAGINVLFAEDGIAELDDRPRAQVDSWTVARNPVDASKWAKEGAALSLRHVPMRMPSNAVVGQICAAYVECLEKRAARAAHVFADLFEGVPMWSASSADGLEATIGWDASGNPVKFRIGGDCQHAFIGGPTGKGKSNLVHVILCSLCHKYSPSELQIYLLDMKDGVEAFTYVNSKTEQAWLPHAKAILASDSPHFAETFLNRVRQESSDRNNLFKRDGARNISLWRAKTGKTMPRILLIADEFTRMFENSDTAKTTSTALRDVLQLARSTGIHVLLATQNPDSLKSSDATVMMDQIGLRLALPGAATGVLAHGNNGADTLSIPYCVLNEFKGVGEDKNQVFSHPLFDSKETPSNPDRFRQEMEAGIRRFGAGCVAKCEVVNSVELKPIPPPAEFRSLLGPEPVGKQPRFNLLLGRVDDFGGKPFSIQIDSGYSEDHLLVSCGRGQDGCPELSGGIRTSIVWSLAALRDKRVLVYDPMRDTPRYKNAATWMGFVGDGATADDLKSELEKLRDDKSRHKVLVLENLERTKIIVRDSPFGDPDPATPLGIICSAFTTAKPFTVIVLTSDPLKVAKILGDSVMDSFSYRIAFGYDSPRTLKEVIRGTEMLDNPGESVFYYGPGVRGEFTTILPYIDPSCRKGGTP